MPGAVAIRVYSLWNPNPIKDWKESISDALIYSAVVAGGWLLVRHESVLGFLELASLKNGDSNLQIARAVIVYRFEFICYAFITPSLLSAAWYIFRIKLGPRYFRLDHPTRTAWDYAFSMNKSCYILFHLKSKTPDGKQEVRAGYFGNKSYVSTYPQEPEIYVQRVHYMAEGMVGQKVDDTAGLLIKFSECERFEFMMDTTIRVVDERRRLKFYLAMMSKARWHKSSPYAMKCYENLISFLMEKKLWRRKKHAKKPSSPNSPNG